MTLGVFFVVFLIGDVLGARLAMVIVDTVCI